MNATLQVPNGRGCGFRTENSVYACCGFDATGLSIENFIIDPVVYWVSGFKRGHELLVRSTNQNISDLVIYVGKEYYPSSWDFVEEVRRFGASRKIAKTVDFNKLTPGISRMIFVHSRAIPNFYYACLGKAPIENCLLRYTLDDWSCVVRGWHGDENNNTPCAFALKDLAFISHPELLEKTIMGESATIQMPSFNYDIVVPEKHPFYVKLEHWSVGAFMWLPLTHFEAKNVLDEKTSYRIAMSGYELKILSY